MGGVILQPWPKVAHGPGSQLTQITDASLEDLMETTYVTLNAWVEEKQDIYVLYN